MYSRPNIVYYVMVFAGGILFSITFHLSYVWWLYPNFEYCGFKCQPDDWGYLSIALFVALAPLIWMPQEPARPSQLIYWWLYVTTYVPSCFVPLYTLTDRRSEAIVLSLWMLLGFALIGVGYKLRLLRMSNGSLSRGVFWPILWLLILMLHLWVLWVFRGNIRIVSFDKVYEEIRFSGGELAVQSGMTYLILWLSCALNPFVMSIGLCYRRPLMFAVGALGQVMLYGTYGLKTIVLSVIFIPAIFMLISWKGRMFGLKLVWGAVILFVLAGIYATIYPIRQDGGVSMLPTLVFLRTFGIPGLLTSSYHDFFANHPATYLSHVSGINLFIEYPYHYSIGVEVGRQMAWNSNAVMQDVMANANAHMWATDGIAAFGDCGIPIVSMICIVVFLIIDSVSAKHDAGLCALIFAYTGLTLGNVSIFTSVFSGGVWLLLLILYLMPSTKLDGFRPQDQKKMSFKLWI